ncbi:MAG: ATP-binding protein [Lachnospiraceae bacterium]|nr:ATP-binding protein [Lachnospiraceae bacterium]
MDRIEKFYVVSRIVEVESRSVYLVRDKWDDWFTYETMFGVVFVDAKGCQHSLGSVKIGQINQEGRTPNIPETFDRLSNEFFSLGVNEYYYENIRNRTLREELLIKLRDISFDLSIFDDVKMLDVTRISLLRDLTETTIRGQFNRMAGGGARLTDYNFSYMLPLEFTYDEEKKLSFNVECEKKPPTNIHVLIGKNGVGKTTILKRMLYAVENRGVRKQVGQFEGDKFSNVIFVSFSAFDMSIDISDLTEDTIEIPYTFVGLVEKERIKSGKMLADDFVDSLYIIVRGAKKHLWEKAIDILESDSTFTELEVKKWSDFNGLNTEKVKASEERKEDESIVSYKRRIEKKAYAEVIGPRFEKLSSGHKVILLTIAKLVQLVEEKTLVLLDEPEEHLHPPLVSAFIRALSNLLIYRNGVGIIATHSPVIVQEVPKKCVWILRRWGNELTSERPRIETFGENLGELTSEIFGYEVTNSGFHKMIQDTAQKKSSYRSAANYFNNELGKEARSILKSYMYEKESE